ncbi:MAG TPA: tRNA pseudouridine(55) synthase TruB [Candidatus Angelobacter sp.]|nr:tRNA pseudouridine(55) synthase TruB [Candidatus Angelobacter sp.]
MDGVLIVDKPAGMTSHDVVASVRRILRERSVGHLGTLDPSATGVLPLVVGRFTRLAQFYTEADKRYEGSIRFGFATDTYDAEGQPTGPEQAVSLSLESIRSAAARFLGMIEQTPPPYSAKKIAGVPAYKLARKNQEVKLKPKQIEIKEFEIVDWDGDWDGQNARFKTWVSSGAYVRSLAHELGQILGPGAHLSSLKRTAVREFRIEEAHNLDDLQRAADPRDLFIHPRLVLPEIPAVTADEMTVGKIRHGAAVNLPEFGKSLMVRTFANQTELIAICRRIAGTLFQPKIVLV